MKIMMKSNISNEIRVFENFEFEIDTIDFDVAMEEDTSNDMTNDLNKTSFAKALMNKVNKLIQELMAIINRLTTKISGISKKMLVTDTGFKKEARNAIVKNRPLEAIKLITFQYNQEVLDNELSAVTKVVFELLSNLKTGYADEKNLEQTSPLDMDKDKLYEYIFKKINCPSNITDINLYYVNIKKRFRGEKKEQLFKSSESKRYYDLALTYDKCKGKVENQSKLLQQQVSILKTNLSNITKNKLSQDTIKRRALKQSSNATHIFNFYSSFLSIYLELIIEMTLNYRIVTKKLYHF